MWQILKEVHRRPVIPAVFLNRPVYYSSGVRQQKGTWVPAKATAICLAQDWVEHCNNNNLARDFGISLKMLKDS